jgi:ABC-type multidrug transport system ATPase subunit
MTEPILALKNVSFAAQNELIIRNISFQYEKGKTTALVGPSGGGKSTMLKLSAGLLVPTQGEVIFRGRNISAMSRAVNLAFRREGAVVFQDSALWANQTIFQILELPLGVHFPRMSGAEREARIREVLAEAGYRRDLFIRPSMLSMGEQKLIGFARALVCRPRLLFLDEWTESLDEAAARRLTGLVKERRARGHTIVFVSHDFRIIKDLADHIVMVSEGRITLECSREQMEADEGLARRVEREISA